MKFFARRFLVRGRMAINCSAIESRDIGLSKKSGFIKIGPRSSEIEALKVGDHGFSGDFP